MTNPVVQTAGVNFQGTTTATVTLNGVTAGNTIWIGATGFAGVGSGATFTATDTNGTPVLALAATQGPVNTHFVEYTAAAGTHTITVTCSSSTGGALMVAELLGNMAGPVESSLPANVPSPYGYTASTGSGMPTKANDLYIALVNGQLSQGSATFSGWTNGFTQGGYEPADSESAWAWAVNTGTSALSTTVTASVQNDWNASLLMLRTPGTTINVSVSESGSAADAPSVVPSTVGWDSDAVSATALTSGNISAQYGTGNTAVGFRTSTSGFSNPTTNMYCIRAIQGTSAEVLENGTVRYTLATPPVAGDLYDVHYDGFAIDYRINGTSVWSTLLQNAALYACVALYDPGDVLDNVQVYSGVLAMPTYWKAFGKAQVTGSTLAKQGGSSTWDSGAYSASGFTTCHIVAKQSATAQHAVIGLSKTPVTLSKTNGTAPDYSWYNNGGTWQILEGTTVVGSYGSVQASDVPAITYDGTTITYLLNNVSMRVLTGGGLSGLTLYGFVWLYEAGCSINSLVFGPSTNLAVVDTQQVGSNAVTDVVVGLYAGPTTLTFGSSSNPPGWARVGVGPYPQEMTVILTGSAYITCNTGTAAEVYVQPFNGCYYVNQYGRIPMSPGQTIVYMYETEVTLPAGQYISQGTSGGPGAACDFFFDPYTSGSSFTISSVMQKIEVIKK